MTKLTISKPTWANGVARVEKHTREGKNLVTELNEENARLLRVQLDAAIEWDNLDPEVKTLVEQMEDAT